MGDCCHYMAFITGLLSAICCTCIPPLEATNALAIEPYSNMQGQSYFKSCSLVYLMLNWSVIQKKKISAIEILATGMGVQHLYLTLLCAKLICSKTTFFHSPPFWSRIGMVMLVLCAPTPFPLICTLSLRMATSTRQNQAYLQH